MEFTKITPQMLAEIRGLAEEVIPGPEIHDDFCHDELAGIHCRPEVLVRARSTEEVSRVMKYAYEPGAGDRAGRRFRRPLRRNHARPLEDEPGARSG